MADPGKRGADPADAELQDSLDELTRISDDLVEHLAVAREVARPTSRKAVVRHKAGAGGASAGSGPAESESMRRTLEELERIGEPDPPIARPFASELHGDKGRDLDDQLESLLGFEAPSAKEEEPEREAEADEADEAVEIDLDAADVDPATAAPAARGIDAPPAADDLDVPEDAVPFEIPEGAVEFRPEPDAGGAPEPLPAVAFAENETAELVNDAVDAMSALLEGPARPAAEPVPSLEPATIPLAAPVFDESAIGLKPADAASPRRWTLLAVVGVVVLALLAWWLLRGGTTDKADVPELSLDRVVSAGAAERATPPEPGPPEPATAATADAADEPAVPQLAVKSASAKETGSETATTQPAPKTTPRPAPPAETKPAATTTPKPAPPAETKPAAATTTARPMPPADTKPAAATTTARPMPPADTKPAPPPAAKPAPQLDVFPSATTTAKPDPPAPMKTAPAATAPQGSSLDAPTAAAPRRVEPQAVERVEPVYPRRAKARGEQGTIVLNVLVNERGQVVRVVVEQGIPGSDLEAAAIDAVLRWTYTPATEGGKPIRAWVVETFTFEP